MKERDVTPGIQIQKVFFKNTRPYHAGEYLDMIEGVDLCRESEIVLPNVDGYLGFAVRDRSYQSWADYHHMKEGDYIYDMTLEERVLHISPSVTRIYIPEKLTHISSLAFSRLPEKTELTVDPNNPAFTTDGKKLIPKKEA